MTGPVVVDETLAARVDASTVPATSEGSVRRHQLRFARTIALSVGIQGPVAGVIVAPRCWPASWSAPARSRTCSVWRPWGSSPMRS